MTGRDRALRVCRALDTIKQIDAGARETMLDTLEARPDLTFDDIEGATLALLVAVTTPKQAVAE